MWNFWLYCASSYILKSVIMSFFVSATKAEKLRKLSLPNLSVSPQIKPEVTLNGLFLNLFLESVTKSCPQIIIFSKTVHCSGMWVFTRCQSRCTVQSSMHHQLGCSWDLKPTVIQGLKRDRKFGTTWKCAYSLEMHKELHMVLRTSELSIGEKCFKRKLYRRNFWDMQMEPTWQNKAH